MTCNTQFGTGLGRKNQKGTVTVYDECNRIRIRWRYLGKRYSINHSSFNHFNLLEAKKLALQLEQDMIMGCFDVTLMKYKKNPVVKEKPSSTQKKKVSTEKSIIELFETWTIKYRQISFDINVHYRGVRSMLKRWSEIKPEQMVDKLNQEKLGSQTYNERLAILKLFSKWLIKSGIWNSNPFEDVRPRKNKQAAKPNREPLTVAEIQKILEAIKNNTYSKKCSRFLHSHYYPFIYFIFQTGVRNAEAVGLRVGSVDITKKVIVIKEVLARTVKGTNAEARVRKETKNGKIRYLPLSDELLEVLQPLLEGKASDDLVFTSHTGVALDDRMFQRRVFKPVLKELGIKERVLYACRHTFGSRCIEAGMTPVMTAFLMGNNPETALRNYVHQMSLPTELPKIL